MRLANAKRERSRLSDAQIANALALGSIVEIAERGGVVWDPRKTRPANGDYWALCPFHAEKSASFHVVERRAQSFFKCMGCDEKGDALALAQKLFRVGFRDAVRLVGGDLDAEPDPELIAAREQVRRELEAKAEQERKTRRAAAEAVFYAAGVHVAGTLGEVYLRRARSIAAPLGAADLRFHARAPLSPYEPAKAGRCPAIVARILSADGEHIGSHLTFLRADGSGKADLPHLDGSRLICGEHRGGFIRLGHVSDAAVVGEGIETTLSASEACGVPGLAAINAANMRALILPAKVRRVIIAHDRDAKGVGQLSAEALAERLWSEGREVEMLPPPESFKDWNAAAMAGALRNADAAGVAA
jgi:phage/plasmid primase-like uncharacterized protein